MILVNAHTHLYSGLAPLALAPPSTPLPSLLAILEQVWWRLDRALDESSLRASARYYVADALEHGASVLIDHHESPNFIEGSLDVLAAACAELGMAAVLCYGATERNGGRDEARRGLDECARFIRSNRRPGISGAIGLHASFTVSDETVRQAGDLCRELGTVLHLHVAEDCHDVEDARQRGYRGVIDRLRTLGALVPGSILAHGVHLSLEEVTEAAGLGCWFVHNPRSNQNNRVGYAAVLDAVTHVALGTDGFAADMVEEAQAVADDRGKARLNESEALALALLGPEAARPRPPVSEPVRQEILESARLEAARLSKRLP